MDYRDFEIEARPKRRKFVKFKDIILYEDDRVIVANKPAGVATLEDREEDTNLLKWAKNYHENAQACHRLDKMTTGVIIFAKDSEAYKEISIQFQEREVVKHYVALVEGNRKFEDEVVDVPLFHSRDRSRPDFKLGKEAMTIFESIEYFKAHTLVNCHPLTGRTHQIRVHLATLGTPIAGDELYGGHDVMLSDFKRNFKYNRTGQENSLNKSMLLHARGLSLVVPGQEEAQIFVAPLPSNFEATLKVLRKYASI